MINTNTKHKITMNTDNLLHIYETEEKLLTLSIFTENKIGLLSRITIVFTRRHLNIESITASESEVKDVHRYTIVCKTTREKIDKVVKQIEKIVEVFKAFVHEEDEVIHQEIALYKLKTLALAKENNIEKIVRDNHARILSVAPEYIVIEKTGHKHETQALFKTLEPFGVLEFARSGRVAITKPMKELSTYLKEFEEAQN